MSPSAPPGVPLAEAPGIVDQGPLPASLPVFRLGDDAAAAHLVLALQLHLPQRLPHGRAAVVRTSEQREC